MKQYVTLTIDGSAIKVPRGSSVLEASLQNGIDIPHLCHLSGTTEAGACGLCIVENVNNGLAKITTSCTLLVKEGMVIRANSDRVKTLRKNIAELLLAQAPGSGVIRDMAAGCGVTDTRYSLRQDECILCGRCVRTCRERNRSDLLGFVGRGEKRRVDFAFGRRPDICNGCQACVKVCPLGGPAAVRSERVTAEREAS